MSSKNIDIGSRIASTGLLAGATSLLLSTLIFAGLATALTPFPVWPFSPIAYAQGFTYPVWGCFIIACGVGTAAATRFWYRLRIPREAQSDDPNLTWLTSIALLISIIVATASLLRLLTTAALLLILIAVILLAPIMFLYGLVKRDGGLVLLTILLVVVFVLASLPIEYYENPLTIDQTSILYNLIITGGIVAFTPAAFIQDSTDENFDPAQRPAPDVTIHREPEPTDANTSGGNSTSDDVFTHIDGIDEADSKALAAAGYTSVEELQEAENAAIADAIDVAPAGAKVSRINAALEGMSDDTDVDQDEVGPSDVEPGSASSTSSDSSPGDEIEEASSTDELKDGKSKSEPHQEATAEDASDEPSRSDLIAALQELDDGRGYPLTTTVRSEGPYTPETYYSEFGSWDEALAAAGIDKEQRLVDEIRRVAEIVGDMPTTTDVKEHSVHSSGTYTTHFSSWDAALEASGLSEEGIDEAAATDASQTSDADETETAVTRGELLSTLEGLVATTEGYPGPGTIEAKSDYSTEQFIEAFGSWEDALDAAGVDQTARIVDELRRLADELGHPPAKADLTAQGRVEPSLVAEHFSSYEAAIEEVFEQTEDSSTPPQLSGVTTLASIEDSSRLDAPIVVKLTEAASSIGEKKEARFRVEDLDGETAVFNVWATHDLGIEWDVGHWYLLESARGKIWETDAGDQRHIVSSTKDLRVTDLGTAKPTATTVTATREASTTQSAADPSPETTKPVTDSKSSPPDTESTQAEMPANGENSGRAISQPELDELSKFKRDILYVLYGLDDPKGLEVKEELEAYYEDPIHHGRLYPNLDALAEAGYVEKFDATGRSNGYRLTETGRSLLVARQKWERARVSTTVSEKAETDATGNDSVESSRTDAEAATDSDEDDETDAGEGDIVDDLMSDLEDL